MKTKQKKFCKFLCGILLLLLLCNDMSHHAFEAAALAKLLKSPVGTKLKLKNERRAVRLTDPALADDEEGVSARPLPHDVLALLVGGLRGQKGGRRRRKIRPTTRPMSPARAHLP